MVRSGLTARIGFLNLQFRGHMSEHADVVTDLTVDIAAASSAADATGPTPSYGIPANLLIIALPFQ